MRTILILSIPLFPVSLARAEPDPKCGLYCLYVALKALDIPVKTIEDLEKELGPPSAAGYSFEDLEKVASELGAKTLGVTTTAENLKRRKRPFTCIAQVLRTNGEHYVLITDVTDKGIMVCDPPSSGPALVPFETFATQWIGRSLLISPNELESEASVTPWNWKPWAYGAAGLMGVLALYKILIRKRSSVQVQGASS